MSSPSLYCVTMVTMYVCTEELGDVKSQLKLLEEKNTTYMQTNMELEEVRLPVATYGVCSAHMYSTAHVAVTWSHTTCKVHRPVRRALVNSYDIRIHRNAILNLILYVYQYIHVYSPECTVSQA